jgi:ATP synthase I chain
MTSDPNPFFGPRLDRLSWVLIAIIAITTLVLYSWRTALSVAVGGALSTVNFHWLKQAVDFIILRGEGGKVGKRIALQYVGRYALIALTLYVTLHFSILDPVFVLAGLLIYGLAVLLEAVFEIVKSLTRDYRNGKV